MTTPRSADGSTGCGGDPVVRSNKSGPRGGSLVDTDTSCITVGNAADATSMIVLKL